MDGNGRWAKQKGRPRIFGHRAGADSVRSAVDTCARLGVKALTLYAFSTENWKRPKREVSGLMQMLKRFLRQRTGRGQAATIFDFRRSAISKAWHRTFKRKSPPEWTRQKIMTRMVLSVALNYGGRMEIVEAAERLAAETSDAALDLEADIERNLYTHGLPEVDLLIRTSGEMRISNFLLWQIAYSEIYVTPTLFPRFPQRPNARGGRRLSKTEQTIRRRGRGRLINENTNSNSRRRSSANNRIDRSACLYFPPDGLDICRDRGIFAVAAGLFEFYSLTKKPRTQGRRGDRIFRVRRLLIVLFVFDAPATDPNLL